MLKACGQVAASRQTIHEAHDKLMTAASSIQNPQFRKTFLEKIRVHRAITAEFESKRGI